MLYRLMLILAVVLLPISPAWAASYTVVPGDTLFLISQRFGTTVNALREANGLTSTTVYPGQVIQVPNGASGSTYTVAPGDTLFLIGQRFGVSAQELMSYNGLTSAGIYPGQVLRIPPASGGGTSYTVVPGDTLFLIGQRFGVSAQQIMSYNGLTSAGIYPGQVLRIPPAPPPQPQPPGSTGYTVSPGDTLFLIGQRFGVSAQQLMSYNGLTSESIYPGQVLWIPPAPPPPPPPPPQPPGSTGYTVSPGDTLFLIGQRFGLSAQQLMSYNGLTSESIYPGQVLWIPPAPPPPPPPPPPPLPVSRGDVSHADFDLLARLITAEAGGEPYDAQVGVGAVVWNRVHSPLFPNDIPGVIYQVVNGLYQFDPVQNGWINKPATSQCVQAAEEALAGKDPTGGALYFYDPTAQSRYIRSLPVACVIGNLTFAYHA